LAEPPQPAHDKEIESRVLEAVVDYVASHPQAMDTALGIAAWWIPGIAERADIRMVRRVLERLTETGVLERIGAGDRAHYRVRKG
jgi:hypothetical protein